MGLARLLRSGSYFLFSSLLSSLRVKLFSLFFSSVLRFWNWGSFVIEYGMRDARFRAAFCNFSAQPSSFPPRSCVGWLFALLVGRFLVPRSAAAAAPWSSSGPRIASRRLHPKLNFLICLCCVCSRCDAKRPDESDAVQRKRNEKRTVGFFQGGWSSNSSLKLLRSLVRVALRIHL